MPNPNPFENPELFETSATTRTEPLVQERFNQLSQEVSKLADTMKVVVSHLKKQAAAAPGHPPRQEQAVPEIRAGKYPRMKSSGPFTLRLPTAASLGPWVNRIAFAALGLLVVFLLLRQPTPPDANANELRATYQRSVDSVKIGTNALALDLRDMAKTMRESVAAGDVSPMSKQDLFKAIQDSIRRATLVSGEGPMKALDQIEPWNIGVVADRLESAADAYSDVSTTVERLKKP